MRLSFRIVPDDLFREENNVLRGFETPAGFDTFGLVENHGLVLVG
jgi:hypothetical protein